MAASAPPRREIPELAQIPLAIDTPRLTLRPLALDDVDALWPYVTDPELPKMMSWAAHVDRGETEVYVRRTIAERETGVGATWAIALEGRVVGVIGLDDITWQLRAWRVDRAELGYWLAPPHWRQGLMSEAAFAVVRWGFETLGLHKIKVGCLDGNIGSRRVIEKLGFRAVGRLEDDVWRDGRWWAQLCYELTGAEWADATRTLRFRRP
jgi:[ribosomal protein S5]-alanine N-acetyltransferase